MSGTVPSAEGVPITVIGGYLGSGKTTLLNALLATATSRIGVIVNDFGDVGIDAVLVADALVGTDGEVPVVNLANGRVCCTLGDGLQSTLATLAELEPPLEHVVIEASGVADPAAAAAWGTVPPFRPGGVVVLAAANSVRRQAKDRYVGGEIRRQLAGADIIVLTKSDLCGPDQLAAVREWLSERSSAATVRADFGKIPADVVLDQADLRHLEPSGDADHQPELAQYVSWKHRFAEPVDRGALDRFLEHLPDGVLRLKGVVRTAGVDAGCSVVQVVGRSVSVTQSSDMLGSESVVTAIGVADVLEPTDLDALVQRHLLAG